MTVLMYSYDPLYDLFTGLSSERYAISMNYMSPYIVAALFLHISTSSVSSPLRDTLEKEE